MSDLLSKLNEKLSSSAVSTRSAGAGKSLSYLTGHYVYSKLNEVLGQGNWSYTIKNLNNVFHGEDDKGRANTSYIAIVQAVFMIGEKAVVFEEVGYGDGIDYNPGKSHELATKEAVTDAVKRAAKNLGPSLGLALYDKEQKDVVDSDAVVVEEKQAAPSEAPAKAASPAPSKKVMLPKAGSAFKKPSLATKPGATKSDSTPKKSAWGK